MNNNTRKGFLAFALGLPLLLGACGDSGGPSPLGGAPGLPEPEPEVVPSALDEQLRGLIDERGLSGDPSTGRDLPSIEDPMAQLGMSLFFSKALGGQTDSACVSCHHPLLGGGDDLALSIGVDAELPDFLGPGRLHSPSGHDHDGGPTVPRNAPTTFNMGLWDRTIFADGRVESLGGTPGANGADGRGIVTPDSPGGGADPAAENLTQAQALFPVTSIEEMRGLYREGASNDELRRALVARLVDQDLPNSWLNAFQVAFDSAAGAEELVTYQNISRAIGAYERSQVFVDTPWKAYVEGDSEALSEEAKRGAVLFFSDAEAGGADCAACHSGDFFTDEDFYVLAVPQLGRGKGDGERGDDDFGRYRVTGDSRDRYAFRTPSLLNVTATGPWGHSGAYDTLEGIVRHHLDVDAALADYDFSASDLQPGLQVDNARANTELALQALRTLRDNGESRLPVVELDDSEVADLLSFLQALTDPCVENPECLSPWIAESGPGPDALRLNASFADDKGSPASD